MKRKLTLGFSSCPNDTFMFDAMVHKKIDTEDLEFEYVIADVEELNERAFRQELDLTKLSYHAFLHCRDNYKILKSGSALGRGCGPLLVSRQPFPSQQLQFARIGIPGQFTTAHFLLRFFLGDGLNTEPMVFSRIEEAILNGSVDAGVIIHESRFTYEAKGLIKLKDLGEYWEASTNLPIPLGAIVIRNSLGKPLAEQVDRILKRSIAFAFEQPESPMPFVRLHAQEMEESVMRAHIHLYVTPHSLDLGREGLQAIERFVLEAGRMGLLPHA